MESLEDRSLLAQLTWDSGGDGVNWDDATNWWNDVALQAGDDLVFTSVGVGTVTNNLPALTAFNTIQFSESGYNVTGAAIQLAGGLTANNTTGTFTLTGDFGGDDNLVKRGSGMLELAGVISRGTDRNNRILEGTLLLNIVAGIQASRGRYAIGSDAPGAPAATLLLGASDQIPHDRGVKVFASGLFDLNGNSEVIGEELTLDIAGTNAGDVNIGAGGTLVVNAGTQVFTQGAGLVGNPGAFITGGTFALQVYGVVAGAGTRTLQVNDGAAGTDLTITSAVVDGTGLQSVGIVKNGFGALELGGSTPNTLTGTTTVNEGELRLNKTGGGALAGPLTIGNNDVTSGFSGSDVVQILQPNQLPDYLALVTIASTGALFLNRNSKIIGVADAQNALSMQASSTLNLGGGTLTINGNIATDTNTGAGIWTPRVAPRIVNGTLNLGNIPRLINPEADRAELPYELEISANLIGTAGFLHTGNSGTILLPGNNSGLSGDIVRTNGSFAVGSDTAFGTSRVLSNGGFIVTYGGKRTLNNEFLLNGNVVFGFIGGNNTAGTGALGGGGNDLTFTGPVNLTTGGTFQPSVPFAAQLEFAGGLGETFGGVALRKIGFGTMVLSSVTTLSGLFEIGQDFGGTPGTRLNGGTVVLRDNGTYLNASSFVIDYGGVLQVDNSGLVKSDRLADVTLIDLILIMASVSKRRRRSYKNTRC